MALFSPRTARPLAVVGVLAAVLSACGATTTSGSTSPSPTPSTVPSSFAPVTVTLLAHDSFAVTKSLLEDFTRRTGITVDVVTGGDAGQLVNKAALTAGNPEGDVLFGVDNTLLSRALSAGVFDPYVSPAAASEPSELKTATKDAVTPIDYGDVCINADTAWFAKKGLPVPSTLEQLADPTYKDLLVVENPETSSPGLAFLLATVSRFGEDGWTDYWKSLRANGVKVVDGWTQAYEDEYSGAGKGSRPLVVSYASSPPAEVVYAADPATAKPVSAVMTDGCFRQVEYAGVLAGTKHPQEARAVVDWLLSPAVQADVPLSMFVYPAVPGTALPKVFTDYAATVKQPLTLDPSTIDDKRAEWLDTWDQVTLR
ncbi:MAG TPA: thiamine ABC transporter substrate-binding protein [Candidatus Nanopelagicales bacterium]|nr:thiamine ABC transporter substrate-binding protein [Candidatus Nanopelagicales bacterium]